MPLHRRILIGFACGAAAGLLLHAAFPEGHASLTWVLDWVAEPAGRLFLRLLLLTVLPLVVSSLLLGVAEMGDAAKLGRAALRTLALTVVFTGLSVVTGLLFVNVIRPGDGFPAEVRDEVVRKGTLPAAAAAAAQEGTATAKIVAMLPDNPIKAAATGDFLGLMLFVLLFGAGLVSADAEKTRPVLKFFEGVFEASMGLINGVMRLAPYGVAALVFNLTARFGWDLLFKLGGYAFTVLAALAFHQFVTYSVLARVGAGLSPREFFRGIKSAMLTAFATSSSSATLPVSLKAAENGLGVPKDISRFVLTVGASANQNGTALYEGVTALFLAQAFGVPLTLGEQGVVLFLSVLGGVGTAGVPGGSLPMLVAILTAIGVPGEAAILILGVDRILDMSRTVLNVSGDLLIAAVLARWEGRKLAPGREPVLAG